jgi:DNA invertase Pin-like site-specific DNA recombinase
MSSDKVTAAHLARRAIIYVRQSTPEQVATNIQSQRRQFGLVDRAIELGWRRDDVSVIDEDLAVSGSGPGALGLRSARGRCRARSSRPCAGNRVQSARSE